MERLVGNDVEEEMERGVEGKRSGLKGQNVEEEC